MSKNTSTARRSRPARPPAAARAPHTSSIRPSPTSRINISAGIVALLAGLTYANTLTHEFVWDDPISVERWLPALHGWGATFFPPANIPQFPFDYYRPLQLLSYQVDQAVGGGNPWSFHLTSILLHVLATVLLFRVGIRLLGNLTAALTAAALFAIHPIHSESVAWMAARPDVMVACAGLAALLAYWHPSWTAWQRSLVAATFIFIALLCKENAFALLLLVPASTALLHDARPPAPPAVPAERVSPLTYLPFGLAAAAYGLLRTAGLGDAASPSMVLPDNPPRALLLAVGTYLRLLIVPYPQNAYIAELPDGIPVLAVSIVIVVGFSGLLYWAWRRDQRPLLFALVWTALALAPSLALLARPPGAPLAERYLYLPSVGACWAAAALLQHFAWQREQRRRAVALGLVTLVLIGCGLTIQRNRVWHDNVSLWADTAAKNRIDGLPLRSFATATLEHGDVAAAERLFHEALKLHNDTGGQFKIYNALGTIAHNRDDDAGAEAYYRKALALQPSPDCLYNIGLIKLRRGMSSDRTPDATQRTAMSEAARSLFAEAAILSPYDPEIQVALGQALEVLGDRTSARQHFEKALSLGLPAATAAGVRQHMDAAE